MGAPMQFPPSWTNIFVPYVVSAEQKWRLFVFAADSIHSVTTIWTVTPVFLAIYDFYNLNFLF